MRVSVPFVAAYLLSAQTAAWADSADHTITTKIVFHDHDYDAHWVDDPGGVARWFVRRGFAEKNVPELKAWLEQQVATNQAIGTSVVFAMGVAPTSIIYPPYDDCLLAHYLEAGGRVVWLSNVPMYVAQSDIGPKIIVGTIPQQQMLGLSTDPRTFYGTENPTLTPAGMLWGLESVNSLPRPVIHQGLAACFFSDPTNQYCGVGLVNFRSDVPHSGFIFMPDAMAPTKEGLLRNAYRLATWSGAPVAIPSAALLPEESLSFTASLRLGEDDIRSTFVRGDIVPIYLRMKSGGEVPIETSAVLTVKDGNTLLTKWVGPLIAPAQESDILLNYVDLGALRRGTYKVAIAIAAGITLSAEIDPAVAFLPGALTLNRDLRVAHEPDHSGTHVALWATASPSAKRTTHLLDWLATQHLEPQFTDDYATGRDLALWHGMSFSVRRIGESAHAPAPPGYDSWRRTANGEIMAVEARGNERIAKGYANPYRRQMEAEDFGQQIAFDNHFPAFRRRAVTSDDYSQWFGIDYNQFAVDGFRARYGFDPPRPAGLDDSNDLGRVTPPAPGIIADDDPWVQLNRYWCEDIHGDTALRLSQAMRDNTQGEGIVGQISGGMQIPVMQLQSAQYPPYFTGDKGYSLISFYYYSQLWQQPLAHIWWLESARMGNRGREQWIMPDSGYEGKQASAIYEHYGWLMLAGGAKGIQYFNHDIATPGGIRAMATFGAISKEYGQLLAELQPARKRAALLVPFEQLLYKHTSSYELLYPFMDLLQAKVDVEPVSPDELDTVKIAQYEAVIVAQTSWLKQSTANLLENYAQAGGKVILDQPSGQALPIEWAIRLNMRIGGTSIYDAGLLPPIAQTKAAFSTLIEPPVDCDDPHITLRRFEAAGAPYLYVNHQMTSAEYLTYRTSQFEDDTLAAQMGYGTQVVQAQIVRPNDGRIPFDVLAHKALPVQVQNGKMRFVLPVPKWQGRIVAFLPAIPNRIKLTSPAKASVGVEMPFAVRVMGKGGDINALFPLHVTVTDPNGHPSIEYSQRLLARAGAGAFGLTFAKNDTKGHWTIVVRDALTGLDAKTMIELK